VDEGNSSAMTNDPLMLIPMVEEFEAGRDSGIFSVQSSSTVGDLLVHEVKFGSTGCTAVLRVLRTQGLVNAALEVQNLAREIQPSNVLLVGIAGALNRSDLSLGDVVLANRISTMLTGAKAVQVDDRWSVEPAGVPYRVLPAVDRFFEWLHQDANGLLRLESWRLASIARKTELALKHPRAWGHFKVALGPLLSDELVGGSEAFRQWILSANRKFMAIEMESAGVAAALEFVGSTACSDFADSKKSKLDSRTKGGWRRLAAANAFSLAEEVACTLIVPVRMADAGLEELVEIWKVLRRSSGVALLRYFLEEGWKRALWDHRVSVKVGENQFCIEPVEAGCVFSLVLPDGRERRSEWFSDSPREMVDVLCDLDSKRPQSLAAGFEELMLAAGHALSSVGGLPHLERLLPSTGESNGTGSG
jgi:nucleoside phosphorylase